MSRIIFFLFLLLCNFEAKNIELNHLYKSNNSIYTYTLNSLDNKKIDTLTIGKKGSSQHYQYAINEVLQFCDHKENDECNDTGISIKKFLFYPNDLIFLIAIKNDKSKILYIYDPKVDQEKPIRQFTGANYVDFTPKSEYLKIKYDGFCDTEDPYTLHENFKE